MKFHKAFKKIKKNKKLVMTSKSIGCYQQNVKSVEYWICSYGTEKSRIKMLHEFLEAKDWVIEKSTDEEIF